MRFDEVTPMDAELSTPVFVVGMNGSGTTMLADSLGHHPLLFVFPFESKLIPVFAQRVGEHGQFLDADTARRLADEIGRTKAFWHANGKQPLVLPPDRNIQPTVAGVFDALFMHMAERAGKHRWVEKSPVNTEHIAMLARIFKQAQFIHIIRDGRDAAQSFHRRWGFDPAHTIWRWKKTVALGREQGRALGPERYMELRYEDLTQDPLRYMREVCNFVAVPFDEAVLSSSMRHMSAVDRAGNKGQIVANSQKWRTYFSADQVRQFEALAGSQLVASGYEVTTRGDAELRRGQRCWLRAKDRLARSTSYFRQYGWRGLPMFMRIVRAAAAQAGARQY
jgi:hypothetical protein